MVAAVRDEARPVSLGVVRGAIARPPSGLALQQLECAEQLIQEVRAVDDLYEAWRHAAGDDGLDASAALMEGVYRLRLRLFAFDQTVPTNKETESSASNASSGSR